jgi:CheY-like chemotaxis protein
MAAGVTHARPEEREGPNMKQARKVLVVDDDAVVVRSINRVLTEQGCQVRETLSGKEALEELDHQAYDVVFTDIRMPGMDGLDLASRMKQRHPETPVVVITGYGTETNERQARDLGVAGFLRKPLSPEMIIENAERVFRERGEMAEAIRQSALALMAPAAATANATPFAVTAAAPAPAVEKKTSVGKNIALFFAAPFIGLAYFLAVPFVGTYAIVKYGWKAMTKSS